MCRCHRNAAITASVHSESTVPNHHDVINELDFEWNYCYFVNYTKKCSLCSGHCTWFPIFSYTLLACSLANQSAGLRKVFCFGVFLEATQKVAQRTKPKNRCNCSSIETQPLDWMVNLAPDGSIREIFFCIFESRDWNVERDDPKVTVLFRVECLCGNCIWIIERQSSRYAICVEGEIYIRSWSRDRHQKLFLNLTFSHLHSRHHFYGNNCHEAISLFVAAVTRNGSWTVRE